MKKMWLPVVALLAMAMFAGFVSAVPLAVMDAPETATVNEPFTITVHAQSNEGIELIGLKVAGGDYEYYTCTENPCTKTYTRTESFERDYVYTAVVKDNSGAKAYVTETVSVIAEQEPVVPPVIETETMEIDIEMDDTFYSGDTIEVEITLENDAEYDAEDVIVQLTVDGMEDSDFESDKFTVRAENEKTKTFDFEIPFDADDGEFDMEVLVSWEDEDGNEYETTASEEFEVERKDHELLLNELGFENAVVCGESAILRAEIFNAGADDEDATIVITNSELGIAIVQQMTFKEGEEEVIRVPLSIPVDADGSYVVDFEVSHADGSITGSAILEATCAPAQTTTPVISTPATGSGNVQTPQSLDYGMIGLLIVLIAVILVPTFWLGKKLILPYFK